MALRGILDRHTVADVRDPAARSRMLAYEALRSLALGGGRSAGTVLVRRRGGRFDERAGRAARLRPRAYSGLRGWRRGVVLAGLAADVADEPAERVAQHRGAVVRAAAPQPPRGPAHGSGRSRGTGFECHHASLRLCGFLVRHYQFTRLAPPAC